MNIRRLIGRVLRWFLDAPVSGAEKNRSLVQMDARTRRARAFSMPIEDDFDALQCERHKEAIVFGVEADWLNTISAELQAEISRGLLQVEKPPGQPGAAL